MKKFLKITARILAILVVLAGLLVWLNYGIYDHRNFPTKIRVFAKTQPDYHVHLKTMFYRARNLRGVCKPLFDIVGGPVEPHYDPFEVTYNNIPDSGIDVELKKSWTNLCKYQLEEISVTCSNTLTYPTGVFGDPSTGNLFLFPYEKETYIPELAKNSEGQIPYQPLVAHSKIPNNYVTILFFQREAHFNACEKECEESYREGFDTSQKKVLNFSCRERDYAF